MKQPKIRFKGFEGEWNETQLSQFFTKVLEKNHKIEYKSVLTNSAEYGIIEQNKFFDHDVANSENIGGYFIVKPDDFVYNPRVSTTAPVGPISRNTLGYTGVMSPLYLVFNIDGIDKDFLCYYYKTSKWYNFMRISGNCGARFDRLAISDDQFAKMPIIYPWNPYEQQAISDYFKSLDSLIQTTTKKIASLKQMKSACLVSMFPQEGETKPRVRFKGFEGEWKKDKAINLFETFNIRNRPELPVLSANQDIRGMAPRTETGYNISHNRANEVTYKVVKPGQFVIHLRSFQGGFAHSSVEGITSPAYTVFGLKDERNHDDYFWKIIFMSKTFVKRLETITYGIRDGRSISFGEFSEMPFLFPCYEEQQKIASFFSTLDTQISLQEQRLEKLKQIKSACLDKMFV